MVEETSDRAEYRSLKQQRRNELLPFDLAVLRVGRLLVVNGTPQALEGLLADDSGNYPSEHAARDKENLAHAGASSFAFILRVSRGSMNGSRSGGFPASI